MNKYEKAIEYFYSVMEKGNIKNDEEKEIFETAIQVLEKENKVLKIANQYTKPSNKYFMGDVVPNVGKINNITKENGIISYELKNKTSDVIIKTEKELDDIMTKYYKSK